MHQREDPLRRPVALLLPSLTLYHSRLEELLLDWKGRMVVLVVETAEGLRDLQLLVAGREVVGVVEDPDIPIAMRLPDLGRTCIEGDVTTIDA